MDINEHNSELVFRTAFWTSFLLGIIGDILIAIYADLDISPAMIFLSLLILIFEASIIGLLGKFIYWLFRSPQPSENKVEINILMQKYLERKLCEDLNKQQLEQKSSNSCTQRIPNKSQDIIYGHNNRSEVQQYRGSINDMYKRRFKS